MSAKEILARLEDLLPPELIIAAAELRAACEVDGKRPVAVVRPRDAEQVGQILALCANLGWAVIPWGSGTSIRLGNVPRAYHLGLDLGGLDQVLELDAANLTLVAGAGCTLRMLQDLSCHQGQFLPLDPPMSDRASLGGVIASDAFGPSRLKYGSVRDITLGLQVALTTGEVIDLDAEGGQGATNDDLTNQFIGSFGSLGVITQATCRLLPMPACSRVLVVGLQTLDAVRAFVEGALKAKELPTSLDMLRGSLMTDRANVALSLVIGLDGTQETVDRQVRDFRQIARDGNAIHAEVMEPADDVIKMVRDLPSTARPPLVVRAGLPISAVGRFWSTVEHLEAEQEASVQLLARAGLGIVYAMVEADPTALGAIAEAMRQLAGQLDGYAIIERIPADLKGDIDVWGPAREDWPLMQSLKSKFDPKGIMSPGRFVGGL